MTGKSKQWSETDRIFRVGDEELRATLENYLQEDRKEDSEFWNFPTIAGVVMLFIAMTALMQNILFLTVGIHPGPDLSGFIILLPIAGGVVLALTGFGLISSKKTTAMPKNKPEGESDPLDAFLYPEGYKEKSDSRIYKETARDYTGDHYEKERYAFSKKKKLFKSRTDKKIAGVWWTGFLFWGQFNDGETGVRPWYPVWIRQLYSSLYCNGCYS